MRTSNKLLPSLTKQLKTEPQIQLKTEFQIQETETSDSRLRVQLKVVGYPIYRKKWFKIMGFGAFHLSGKGEGSSVGGEKERRERGREKREKERERDLLLLLRWIHHISFDRNSYLVLGLDAF